MPLSEAAILAYEQKQKLFKCPHPNFFIFYVMNMSFICTNFEAFTTFSAIFTLIRQTIYKLGDNFHEQQVVLLGRVEFCYLFTWLESLLSSVKDFLISKTMEDKRGTIGW